MVPIMTGQIGIGRDGVDYYRSCLRRLEINHDDECSYATYRMMQLLQNGGMVLLSIMMVVEGYR